MDLLLSEASPQKICLQIGLCTFDETRGVDMGIKSVVDEEKLDDASYGLKRLHDLGYFSTFAWPCMAPPNLCKTYYASYPPCPSPFIPPLQPTSFIPTGSHPSYPLNLITTKHSHVQLITSFTTPPTSLLAHFLPLPIQTNSLVHGHPHFPTSSYAPYPPLTVDFISTLFICLRVISTHLQFESMLLKAEIW